MIQGSGDIAKGFQQSINSFKLLIWKRKQPECEGIKEAIFLWYQKIFYQQKSQHTAGTYRYMYGTVASHFEIEYSVSARKFYLRAKVAHEDLS